MAMLPNLQQPAALRRLSRGNALIVPDENNLLALGVAEG